MSYYITYACLTPISSLAARSPCFWREKRTGAKKKISHDTQKNRSSSTNPFANLTDIGGVNSIRQFSRSWQRAAVFHEVIPQRPSFAFAPDQEPVQHATAAAEPNHQYARGDVEAGPRASLLRERLEAHDVSENAIGEGDDNDEGGNGAAAADPASSHLAAGDDHLHEAKRQRSGSDLSGYSRPQQRGAPYYRGDSTSGATRSSRYRRTWRRRTSSAAGGRTGATGRRSSRTTASAGRRWRMRRTYGASSRRRAPTSLTASVRPSSSRRWSRRAGSCSRSRGSLPSRRRS